ncbi:cystinosin homolog isoform X1 [Episyrphus balteatus]|uniref:cystinosin homolog isoform X1 n=1 Tax=Episyrphus balteatus TaxID=286459 RepID=UPI0024858C70|nr:cystinosin homolog isoform X1 [Episyrphus balteatus]XP_055848768.1 cystinosin homolog isoform X1 [Episyrphus balteatus]XP_055848769.1 cystinosin homolog isoform X1 [Episyrphus balteatus]
MGNIRWRSTMASVILATAVICLVSRVSSQEHPYSLSVSKNDITVLVNSKEEVDLMLHGTLNQNISITFIKQHPELIDIEPPVVKFDVNNPANATFNILGLKPGSVDISASAQPNETWIIRDIFMRVKVANSMPIVYISSVFGWVYFIAWSISFYPQIYTNFKRKSVVGLNFDFLALNFIGFLLYSIFNIGLYWIPTMQAEYFSRHPRGLNPVLVNDVVFSLHAMFATSITIFQCFIYERAEQRISITARGIVTVFILIVVITAGLAWGSVVHWLDFLYYCSYIKLTITLIKYIPQAAMNYRRKSTVGWSIGNILLDFVGGTLSMLQMILNAYNYDDWVSIFGDPTKFGLGLFSVLFDIFFMLQHYVFYRNLQPYEFIPGNVVNQINSNQRRHSEIIQDEPFRLPEVA